MRILLVGPGALGCLLAAVISRTLDNSADHLSILDHNQERAALLNSQGIVFEADGQQHRISLTVTTDPAASGAAEAVILCVKSHDIARSLQFCQPLLNEGPLLLFLQNGIAHLDDGQPTGRAAIAYGTTTEGATLLGPGHVRHAGHGLTHLGFRNPDDDAFLNRLNQLAGIFSRAGLPTITTDRIIDRLWAKLFINVGINALTAIHDCANGDLLTLAGARERMRTAVAEAEMVARLQGIRIDGDPFAATEEVCRKTAGNISSMLQDVRRRRRTEIDAINGAVVRAGRQLGVDTPENARLLRQVREIESDYSITP
jgi:2-dehydropantoate 2-reductase